MITANQILTATNQRIVELGTLASKNAIVGKESKVALSDGKRLLVLKKAYLNNGLTEDEKESLLYCMIRVSQKFDQPAIRKSGGLNLDKNVVKPSTVSMFQVGINDDVVDSWGLGDDVTGYL